MFTFVAEERRKDTQAVDESFNVWSLKTICHSFHLRKVKFWAITILSLCRIPWEGGKNRLWSIKSILRRKCRSQGRVSLFNVYLRVCGSSCTFTHMTVWESCYTLDQCLALLFHTQICHTFSSGHGLVFEVLWWHLKGCLFTIIGILYSWYLIQMLLTLGCSDEVIISALCWEIKLSIFNWKIYSPALFLCFWKE